MTMRLNLGEYLQEHGITAYRVAQESHGELAPNTVYAMAKKPAQRIDLDTVSKIIAALVRIQKKKVTIVDLIQEVEEPKLHGDPNRSAFDAGNIKAFNFQPRQDRPAALRPSEDLVSDLRDRK